MYYVCGGVLRGKKRGSPELGLQTSIIAHRFLCSDSILFCFLFMREEGKELDSGLYACVKAFHPLSHLPGFHFSFSWQVFLNVCFSKSP